MIRYTFRVLVFQNGNLDDTLEFEHIFADMDTLLRALVVFSARNSEARRRPQVRDIHQRPTVPPIDLPHTKNGYGPDTVVVIESMTLVG
jgi:hypothetical protein